MRASVPIRDGDITECTSRTSVAGAHVICIWGVLAHRLWGSFSGLSHPSTERTGISRGAVGCAGNARLLLH